MSYYPNNLYTIRPGPRSRHPHPLLQTSRFVAREWLHGFESFSDWIKDFYDKNKEALPYVFATKLEKTVRGTIELEEGLAYSVQDGYDPLQEDPFAAYNDYVEVFADITTYISRLLPEEKSDPFVTSLTRALNMRKHMALEVAEASVKDGFTKKLQQMRASSNFSRGVDNPDR